ncbi:GATA transcription factor 1 [Hirschfeldia incana]|nr:GATA transcription factor 1 [Hirschfeldia incana]
MESFMDELLNFSVPEDEGTVVHSPKNIARRKTGLRQTESFGLLNPDDDLGEIEEEDLEWISNKDAFPVIETFVGVLPSEHFIVSSPEREVTEGKQLSPVSVLETSSQNMSVTTTTNSNNSSSGSNRSAPTMISCCVKFNAPVKTRSKRRRRDDLRILWSGNEEQLGGGAYKRKMTSVAVAGMGRKCQHCGADKTPQWRAGPSGPKTLCNACGVRYKSGRLVPEYRPANSPTFSPEFHSNSHRKIVEMRKHVVSGDGGGDGRKDCG